MTCDFTSFRTVFQSYQDDGGDNERLCATEPPLRLKQSSGSSRIRTLNWTRALTQDETVHTVELQWLEHYCDMKISSRQG